MLTRRHLLLGSALALTATAARARADDKAGDKPGDAPGLTVLRAGKDGFNGAVPGPVIRARRGDEVRVRFVNGLDEPAALCWHGVRAAIPMDGSAPSALVAPGASFDYRFAVPDAGTFWYRAVPRAWQEAGLYGALIVAEPAPPPVDQDHVIVFDIRPSGRNGLRRGVVNGAASLDIAVRPNERLRLRFVNASAAHAMDARISDHRVMMMALDGEPAEPFESRDGALALGPGNRADVFVDATLGLGRIAPVTFAMEGGEAPTVRLVYGAVPARSAPPGAPSPLPANPLPERMNLARALRVTLPIEGGGGAPNHQPQKNARQMSLPQMPPPQLLFAAERARTVVMALDNRDAGFHVVHLRGHHVRLLDRFDDGWKPYWLDTIPVPPRQTVRIAFVADSPGRWLIESHAINGPEAAETWFEVR